MSGSKLFKRTFLLTLVVFGVIAVSIAVLIAWTLKETMTREYLAKGEAVARSIANTSAEVLLNRDAATIQSYLDQYLEIPGISYVFVAAPEGEILAHTFVPALPPGLDELGASPAGPADRTIQIAGRAYIDVSMPILAGVAGYVHVGMDQRRIIDLVLQAIIRQQGILAVIMGLSLAVLYVLVGRVSRPLVTLTEYAQRLARHDFSADIEVASRDELGMLANSMRSMASDIRGLVGRLEHEVQVTRRSLQDALTYLQTIIDNLADGLLVVDIQGRVSRYNPALLDMFGYSEGSDIAGKDVSLVFPPDLAALSSSVRGLREGSRTSEIELADGNTGKAVARPILKHEGEMPACLGSVILVRDVSAEKEVDRMKTDFITTVSHELRTPLTSVLGFAKIIAKRFAEAIEPHLPASEKRSSRAARQIQENLAIIVSEGERLTDLINDVLDISKMEAGKLEWRLRQTDLGSLIRQSVASIRSLAESKGLACVINLSPDLPPAKVDRDRIIQVLVNLLSNALKFTHEGSITVGAEASQGRVFVSVADTGLGIPEKDQGHIFERFKQAGDTLTEKPKGTGLGLPICRYIVESHGGRIWVESEPGKGSTFHFTLPLSDDLREFSVSRPPVEKTSRQLRRDRSDGAARILVVDDDPAMRSYLRQVLEGEGYAVDTAEDGFRALETAVKNPPDLITMDLMMPHLDGGTVIQALRSHMATRTVPVLVITALDHAVTEGADASLTKPVNEDRLTESVAALLHAGRTTNGPCMVLSDATVKTYEGLPMICQGEVSYCALEELKERVSRGFEGTIFVPASLAKGLDLCALSAPGRVQIVILPAGPRDNDGIDQDNDRS